MKKSLLFFSLLSIALLNHPEVSATVWYVNSANGSATQDGKSWATAFSNFQVGINAGSAGDDLWVAAGTYVAPGGGSFIMAPGVQIYGGFAGNETSFSARNWMTNVTILQGNGSSVIANDNNGLNATAVLDGFTVTGGAGYVNYYGCGAGMYNYHSSPTINNTIFSGNNINNIDVTSLYPGGGSGMYNRRSSPTVTNCTFTNNTAIVSVQGSGMLNDSSSSPLVSNTSFTYNSSEGMCNFHSSSPVVTNCIFAHNTGSAMDNEVSSSPVVNKTSFLNNWGGTLGGGMQVFKSSPVMIDCIFSGNTSPVGYGGGVQCYDSCFPVITNCVFNSDTAYDGGAIYLYFNCSATITNSTFSSNLADYTGGGAICGLENYTTPVTIVNSVFWGNVASSGKGPDIYDQTGTSFLVSYSFTQTTFAAAGNITGKASPFLNIGNPAGADGILGTADDGLEPATGSPAIGTGSVAAIPPGITTDITGAPRTTLNGTIVVNMGAYESPGPSTAGGSGVMSAHPHTEHANSESTDSSGWTSYYYNDTLLLSLQKKGQNIGTIGDGTFDVSVVATAGAGSGVAVVVTNPLITNTSGFWAMNRYWNVTATTEPTSNVGVRFYYNNQDLADVNGSYPTHNVTNQQLIFYKETGGSPDPTTNLAGVTALISILRSTTTASNTTWTFTQLTDTTQYAEFSVAGFSGGGGGATGNGQSLPITLLSFTGTREGAKNLLQWSTTNELNSSYFEVERSVDGISFESIGQVSAVGNSSMTTNYSFTDNTLPSAGGGAGVVVYYRLKMVDLSGQFNYSNVVLLNGNGSATAVSVYPDPTTSTAVLLFDVVNPGKYFIAITDVSGKMIKGISLTSPVGINTATLDLGGYVSGTYLITLTDAAGYKQTLKLNKQ